MFVNRNVGVQEFVFLYIFLVMGVLYNFELLLNDFIVEEYLILFKICFVKGEFMVYCMIIGVMVLVSDFWVKLQEVILIKYKYVMVYFYLEIEKGRNGDFVWFFWGLVM